MGFRYDNPPSSPEALRQRAMEVERTVDRYPHEERNNISTLGGCLSHTMLMLADALDRIAELERKVYDV